MPTQENTTRRRLLREYGEALADYTELQADVSFFAAKAQDLEKPSLRFKAAAMAAWWLQGKYDRTWAKRPAHAESAVMMALAEAIRCANWDAFVSDLEDWTALYATNEAIIAGAGPQLLQEDRAIPSALAQSAARAAARTLLIYTTPLVTEADIATLAAAIINLMAGQHQSTLPPNITPADAEAAIFYESTYRQHTPVLLCLGAYTTKQDLKDTIDKEWDTRIRPHLQTAPPAAHRPVEYKRHVALYEYYLAFWATRRRPAEDKKAQQNFSAAVRRDRGFWASVWQTVPSPDQVGSLLRSALEWLPCDREGGLSREGFWSTTMALLPAFDLTRPGEISGQFWRLIDEETQPERDK